MPVPVHAALHKGTHVSIVLKQDQRTGRQVQGIVSDILTRANHPRGVKVRLSDGRVGRVQSLMAQNQQQGYGSGNNPFRQQQLGAPLSDQYAQAAYRGPQQGYQQNPNLPARPSGTSTLEDFIPASERGEQVEYMENYENSRAQTKDELDREALQKQFPNVDGSLIAAIYGDCGGEMSGCREMLQALSED